MIVVALTNLNPITLRSIEVKNRYEAYDLYSQNPNYIIAFVNNKEITILGSKTQKESQYEILCSQGYIFKGKKVKYLCDELV
ncbi:MAG: hypothetical protein H7Y13_04995 [Sphingobacteriaceae bacterium]|nr:hypothetical protein [Sphingobacteriaceae bacterium]